jgi:hypothetical protein
MPMGDERGRSGTAPATPQFTQEMERLLRAAVESSAAGGRVPARRLPSPRWLRAPLLVGATAVVVLLVLGAPLVGGGARPARAATGMVFPDGDAVDILGAVVRDGDLQALRRRLAEFGVSLEVRERPVPKERAGRVLRIQLPPGAEVDDQHRMVVAASRGGSLVVEIGKRRGDEPAPAPGEWSIVERHPELCQTVNVHDPIGTAQRLAELGYRVDWKLVVPRTGAERSTGAPVTDRIDLPGPREDTFIIAVLAGEDATSQPAESSKTLVIEMTPTGSSWHAPAKVCG